MHILRWKFMDLSLSQNFFDLDTYFSKRRVLRASKRDLEREISTTVDQDWIFFLAEVSKNKASRWRIFYSPIRIGLKFSGRELSIHSIITVIHFYRTIKLYKRFYKIISRNYELHKFWSVDYSSCFDFRYFLSHSTTPRINASCHANRWTDHTRLFRALQSRNWNARFRSTKKKRKASEKVKKSEFTL